LYYNKEEGDFYWLLEKKGRDLTKPAGTQNNNGYRTISINGYSYAQHRLAFFWVTGHWPPEYVDHKDGNPSNNKWDNLLLATAKENSLNRKRKFDSLTGIKGVTKDWRSDTWHVHMMIDNKVVSRGPFFSYEKACREYDTLATAARGECHRPEPPREQRARFRKEDVQKSIEEYLDRKLSS